MVGFLSILRRRCISWNAPGSDAPPGHWTEAGSQRRGCDHRCQEATKLKPETRGDLVPQRRSETTSLGRPCSPHGRCVNMRLAWCSWSLGDKKQKLKVKEQDPPGLLCVCPLQPMSPLLSFWPPTALGSQCHCLVLLERAWRRKRHMDKACGQTQRSGRCWPQHRSSTLDHELAGTIMMGLGRCWGKNVS